MRSLYLNIAFAIAVVATGVIIMSASFSDASVTGARQNLPSTSVTSSGTGTATSVASVANLVGGLEDRLRQTPDDGKGWLLLAKSYRHLDKLDDAREAYRKADALGYGDPVVAEQLFGLNSEYTARFADSN